MTIDGDIDGIIDEVAFLRAFVALVKEHKAAYWGWIDAENDVDGNISGTFSWEELQAALDTQPISP